MIIGCTSQVAQLEKEWLGIERNNLIAAKGTPDQVMDDGLGGQIYTYVKIESFSLPGRATTHPTGGIYTSKHGWQYGGTETKYSPTQTFTNITKTMFWINSAGEIYKVSIAR
jgi:hypothetical protein